LIAIEAVNSGLLALLVGSLDGGDSPRISGACDVKVLADDESGVSSHIVNLDSVFEGCCRSLIDPGLHDWQAVESSAGAAPQNGLSLYELLGAIVASFLGHY